MGFFNNAMNIVGAVMGGGNTIAALTTAADIISANSQNAKAKRQADVAWNRQQQWDEYKLRNAHQIEIADLKAAGMNPAYTTQTAGAQSGTLSATPANVTGYGAIGSNALNNINSLTQVQQRQQEIDNQEKLINAQIGEIDERTKNITPQTRQNIRESKSREAYNAAETQKSKTENELLAKNIEYKTYENQIKELETSITQEPWYKWKLRVDAIAGTIGEIFGAGSKLAAGVSALRTANSIAEASKNLQALGYKGGVREFMGALKNVDPKVIVNKYPY